MTNLDNLELFNKIKNDLIIPNTDVYVGIDKITDDAGILIVPNGDDEFAIQIENYAARSVRLGLAIGSVDLDDVKTKHDISFADEYGNGIVDTDDAATINALFEVVKYIKNFNTKHNDSYVK